MSCCNSNCNHDPCGSSFNQSVTKAAQYAQYAQTQANAAAQSAEDANNTWLEFNALYLGSFAAAPTTDNEGNPLQEGALYFNSVSNQMFVWQGGSWIDFDFDEFTPFTATGTTAPRNLVTRMADVANVLDFGADPTGVADSSTAFQNALNLLNSRQNGGMLLVPAGTFKVNSQLNYSNKDLSIVGFGKGVSTIIKTVSDPSGNIFNFTTNTLKVLTVKDLQFQVTGNPGNAGTAINGVWPVGLGANTTCVISDLDFGYFNGSGANNRFSNCIKLRGAAESSITNISSQFVNSSDTTHIRLDCHNNGSAYGIVISNVFLNGGLYGIYQTGWMEMLMVSKGEIVGQTIGILADSSASLIPSSPVGYNPLIEIKDIHINSKEWNIKTIQWDAIHINGVELYHGVGSGSEINGGNILLDKGRRIRITNNKFESPLSMPIQDIGLHLKNIDRAIVSGNLFLKNSFRNIFVEDSTNVSIEGNAFYPGFAIENSIRLQNTTAPLTAPAKARIVGNTFQDAAYAIWIEGGLSDCDILGNTFDDIGSVPILLDSPRIYGQQVAIQGNKSIAWERKRLTENDATPSVSGAQEGLCYHANSSPTTITDFVDGYASQTIDIEANNGNTTIQHNANIRLQGGVDFTMAAGNRLYLRKEDSSSGSSWYEIGRLT